MIRVSIKNRVSESLSKDSLFAARLFDKTFHHPTRAQEAPTSILINDLNTYWRLQLGSLNVDTINARSALIDTADFEKWFELFEQFVKPVVLGPWVSANGGGR